MPLIQKRLENQRHVLQIMSILARMRTLEGKKQESDESQDEKKAQGGAATALRQKDTARVKG